MRAFEGASWPTSVAVLSYGKGEDVVMNLFIFFVFADDPPVDGRFAGWYQLEYTTATTTPAAGELGRTAATSTTTAKSDRRAESNIAIIGR